MKPQSGWRRWGLGFADASGLAAVLALVDASIHGYAGNLLQNPAELALALNWIWGVYVAAALLLALIFRRRSWVAALCVFAFALGQAVLWFYQEFPSSASIKQASVGWPIGLAVAVIVLAFITGLIARNRFAVWTVRCALVFNSAVAIAMFFVPMSRGPSISNWASPRAANIGITKSRPNVLLVTLDTLRPDHLGAYGYPHIETPNLDAVAREGTLFERAITSVPITAPSHMSLLTGLYPARHGLRRFSPEQRPGSDVTMLAQIMRGVGYHTGAIIAAAPLNPAFGLAKGFDVYDFDHTGGRDPFRRLHRALVPMALARIGLINRHRYRDASEITDSALRWINRYKDRPFFLWVHYFDSHSPYSPRLRYRNSKFHPGVPFLDRFSPIYVYDSEIVGIDAQFGRLMEGIDAHGVLDDTLVVIVSDHGDGLGDHSYFSHTHRLFEEQLRIALMLRYPAKIPEGRRIKTQVRIIDIMPTVLEFVDLPVPAGLDGKSLSYLLPPGIEGVHRTSFAETLFFPTPAFRLSAVSDGRYKLIRSEAGDRWLFDLEEDPAELENLMDQQPGVAARLEELLEEYLSIGQREADTSVVPTDIDESLRDRLRDLGYGE